MEKELLIKTVTAAQGGDSTALNTLFGEFYNDIYYFALKTLKDENLAQDITQEAFIEIFNTIGNLKEPAAFVTWMKQITYHQCTRFFRKKSDVLVSEDEDGGTIFDSLTEENSEFIPDEALNNSDFKKTILSIIDGLKEDQRTVTMLYYFEEMSYSEIEQITGLSTSDIKNKLFASRKAIKKSVEEYEKKNNIKLHAFPFIPFFKWIIEGTGEISMSATAIKSVAEGVTAATGVTVNTSAATIAATATATTTATAATASTITSAAATTAVASSSIAAKIVALPIVTKIIAGIVTASVVIGGTTTAIIMSSEPEDTPASTSSIVVEQDEESLILEGTIPEGCTYVCYNGTTLTAGQQFPETMTSGDYVLYGDYAYGYECVSLDGKEWHLWKDGFDDGDSGLNENDVTETWFPVAIDKTKTSYSKIATKINGKDIRALYATFYECKNLIEAPAIPSTVRSISATFYGCTSLKQAPRLHKNIARFIMAFYGCTSLTGDIFVDGEVDTSTTFYYSSVFEETVLPINLISNNNRSSLELLALNSNRNGITIDGKPLIQVTDKDNNQQEIVKQLKDVVMFSDSLVDTFSSPSELNPAHVIKYCYYKNSDKLSLVSTTDGHEVYSMSINDINDFTIKTFGMTYDYTKINHLEFLLHVGFASYDSASNSVVFNMQAAGGGHSIYFDYSSHETTDNVHYNVYVKMSYHDQMVEEGVVRLEHVDGNWKILSFEKTGHLLDFLTNTYDTLTSPIGWTSKNSHFEFNSVNDLTPALAVQIIHNYLNQDLLSVYWSNKGDDDFSNDTLTLPYDFLDKKSNEILGRTYDWSSITTTQNGYYCSFVADNTQRAIVFSNFQGIGDPYGYHYYDDVEISKNVYIIKLVLSDQMHGSENLVGTEGVDWVKNPHSAENFFVGIDGFYELTVQYTGGSWRYLSLKKV